MRRTHRLNLMALAGLIVFYTNSALAITGLEVMEKVDKANSGVIGSESEMTMTLIDAKGNKVERQMSSMTIESDQGDKSIMEFSRPLDVKGTKLLTWTIKDKANQQWLYLPQFKRVKKINSKNQSGSFMGSEFSYEDIAGEELEKYEYQLLSEDKDTWTVESKPKEASGYSKLITVISKDKMNPLSVEYYDRRGGLLKKSKLTDYESQKVGNKTYHLAKKIEMKNEQTKKSSIIEWKKRKLGVKNKESDFKSNRLKR